jgi:hypothetical protein
VTVVLIIIAAAVIAYGRWRLSLRRHPYAPCRWCVGRSGRNPGSNRERWGKCRKCGGTGKRLRLGARER